MLPGLATMIHSSASATAGGGLVAISDTEAYKYTVGAGAVASYSLGSDGKIRINGDIYDTWLKSGLASAYDVRATVLSGSVSSGTTGSWLNLSAARTWSRGQPAVGITSVDLTIEIALAGTAVAIASATITITSERDIDSGTL